MSLTPVNPGVSQHLENHSQLSSMDNRVPSSVIPGDSDFAGKRQQQSLKVSMMPLTSLKPTGGAGITGLEVSLQSPPPQNNPFQNTSLYRLQQELLMLPSETLASLLASAMIQSTEVVPSVVPEIIQAKTRRKDELSTRIESRTAIMVSRVAHISSHEDFPKTFKVLHVGENPHNLSNKFLPFPRLPLELRLIVWKAAFGSPRLLKILVDAIRPGYRAKISTTTKMPITLHVNQESRKETLNHFELSFDASGVGDRIYVDFSTDIISWTFTMAACRLSVNFVDFGRTLSRLVERSQLLSQINSRAATCIQRLTCSYREFCDLFSKQHHLGTVGGSFERSSYGALREIFVDLTVASSDLQIHRAAFSDLSRTTLANAGHASSGTALARHDERMLQVENGIWEDETEPDSEFKKTLIDECNSKFQTAKALKPELDGITLRFGRICRRELFQQILDEEIAAKEIGILQDEVKTLKEDLKVLRR